MLKMIALAAVAILGVSSAAPAHDAKAMADAAMGDPTRGKWFESLKQPGLGTSCCNLTDCHQTQARQLPDQTWRAILHDYKGDRWVAIPPDKVVKRPLSVDGEAYICNSEGGAAAKQYDPGMHQTYEAAPWEASIFCSPGLTAGRPFSFVLESFAKTPNKPWGSMAD